MTDMPEPPPRTRFPWLGYVITAVVILVLGAAPAIGAVMAGLVGQANGCVVNEAGSNPCVIFGSDWGDALVFFFVAGWYALITLPTAMFCLMTLFVIFIVHLLIHSGTTQGRRLP